MARHFFPTSSGVPPTFRHGSRKFRKGIRSKRLPRHRLDQAALRFRSRVVDYETTEHRFILDVLIGNVLIFTFSCYSFLKYTFFFSSVQSKRIIRSYYIREGKFRIFWQVCWKNNAINFDTPSWKSRKLIYFGINSFIHPRDIHDGSIFSTKIKRIKKKIVFARW